MVTSVRGMAYGHCMENAIWDKPIQEHTVLIKSLRACENDPLVISKTSLLF